MCNPIRCRPEYPELTGSDCERSAERVVTRLVETGVLGAIAKEDSRFGRPALRWHVNPMLAGAQGEGAGKKGRKGRNPKNLDRMGIR
jgi:hypothetical protein